MIFDGSTYRTRGAGIPKKDYVECLAEFTVARNESVVSRLKTMKKLHEDRGHHYLVADLRQELANEIDISQKTVQRIVKEMGAGESLHPSKGVRYKSKRLNSIDFPELVEEVVIVKPTKNYNTCAWA
jgi:hypothetical protein